MSNEWRLISVREYPDRIERIWRNKKTNQTHKDIEWKLEGHDWYGDN